MMSERTRDRRRTGDFPVIGDVIEDVSRGGVALFRVEVQAQASVCADGRSIRIVARTCTARPSRVMRDNEIPIRVGDEIRLLVPAEIEPSIGPTR